MAKRKGYAIITLTRVVEVEVMLDDDNTLSSDESYALVKAAAEKKYGKLGDDDEIEIEEMDYAE